MSEYADSPIMTHAAMRFEMVMVVIMVMVVMVAVVFHLHRLMHGFRHLYQLRVMLYHLINACVHPISTKAGIAQTIINAD